MYISAGSFFKSNNFQIIEIELSLLKIQIVEFLKKNEFSEEQIQQLLEIFNSNIKNYYEAKKDVINYPKIMQWI